MEYLSKNLEDTSKIAADFVKNLKPKGEGATIVGLYGELGSGKTTFMKLLARNLGVKEEITSPTFVIMKYFDLSDFGPFHKLIHIDAYRIEREDEMLVLGWKDMVSNPQNLIFIEWPEKIEGLLRPHIVVKFEHAGETERKISIA